MTSITPLNSSSSNVGPSFSQPTLAPQQISQGNLEQQIASQAGLINPLRTPLINEISPTDLREWQKNFRPLLNNFARQKTLADLNWNSKMPFHMCLIQELYILTQKIDIGNKLRKEFWVILTVLVANFHSRVDSEDVESILRGNSAECSECVNRIIVEINKKKFRTATGREYQSKLLMAFRLLECLLKRTDFAIMKYIWFEHFSTVLSNELNLTIDKSDGKKDSIVAEDLIKTALHFIELYPSPKEFSPVIKLCTSLLASKSVIRGTFHSLEEERKLQSSLTHLFSLLQAIMSSDSDGIIKLVSNQLFFILETTHMIQRQNLVSLIIERGFWGINEKSVMTTLHKNLTVRFDTILDCLTITSIEKFVDTKLLKIVKNGCKSIEDLIKNNYFANLSIEKPTLPNHLFNIIESLNLLEQTAESYLSQLEDLPIFKDFYTWYQRNEDLKLKNEMNTIAEKIVDPELLQTSAVKFEDPELLKIAKIGAKSVVELIKNDYFANLSLENPTLPNHLNDTELLDLLEQKAKSYLPQIEDSSLFKDFYAQCRRKEDIGLKDVKTSAEFLLLQYFFELLGEIYGVAACITKLTFDRLPQNSQGKNANTEMVNAIFASFDIQVNAEALPKDPSSIIKTSKRKSKRRKGKKSIQRRHNSPLTKGIITPTLSSEKEPDLEIPKQPDLEIPKQIEPLSMPVEQVQTPLPLAPKKIKVFKSEPHRPLVKPKQKKEHAISEDSILSELARRNVSPSKLLKVLKKEGWYKERSHGSHDIMRCIGISGSLTVPTSQSTLKTGTLRAIKKQVDDLRAKTL